MTLQQFLLILRARAKIALFTLFATVLTTLVVSLVMPKQYTASTAVVIDVKSPDPIAGMVLPGMISPGYMATQVDIINNATALPSASSRCCTWTKAPSSRNNGRKTPKEKAASSSGWPTCCRKSST